MKKTLLFLIIITYCVSTHSQFKSYLCQWRDSEEKKSIDDCQLFVTYSYKLIIDTIKKKPYFDRYVLEIGEKYSKYYSLFADRVDSTMFLFAQSKEGKKIDAATNPRAWMRPTDHEEYDEYFFNYPSQGLLTVTQMIVNAGFAYQEPIPQINWEIQPETSMILGYTCQRASTVFRGRKYEAWFTMDIPTSLGPWKLNGLPGLILKANTIDSNFVFEAIGIEVPKTKRSIYRYDLKYNQITREDMLKLQRKTFEDPVSLWISCGIKMMNSAKSKGGNFVEFQPGEIVQPYVPNLELE